MEPILKYRPIFPWIDKLLIDESYRRQLLLVEHRLVIRPMLTSGLRPPGPQELKE